jgi:hypothetical protein
LPRSGEKAGEAEAETAGNNCAWDDAGDHAAEAGNAADQWDPAKDGAVRRREFSSGLERSIS